MGASDKFKEENEPAKGGEYYVLFNVPPSIAMAEWENASAGGEKDHRMGFRMVDIMTRKILKKN